MWNIFQRRRLSSPVHNNKLHKASKKQCNVQIAVTPPSVTSKDANRFDLVFVLNILTNLD